LVFLNISRYASPLKIQAAELHYRHLLTSDLCHNRTVHFASRFAARRNRGLPAAFVTLFTLCSNKKHGRYQTDDKNTADGPLSEFIVNKKEKKR